MATAALEFTLRMNTDDVQRGMTRARGEVATGMRGMAQAARTEAQRIQSSLNAINLSQSLPQRINQTRTALGAANAEAARLGTTFQRSQADLRGLTEQIGRASAQLARLQQTPASRRTSVQNAEILAIQQTIQNLRAQAETVRGFTTTLGRDHDRARGSVARLNSTLSAETAELTRLRAGLQASGIDTNRLAEAQVALQASMARTVARARELQRTQNARDVLNLGPRVNTDRDVLRLQAAYERLRTTGNLTATELARAHVRMTEGIVALRNGTDGLASRFALVREEVAKLAIAGAGIGLAVREAIAFESAMSDVRKVVDFPTPKAFDEMTASIKGMSREIPVGLVGLAKIAEAGGQMGIAAKDIQGFTDVVAKMSTAFKIGPDEAGTAVGRLMNIFALTVPQTKSLADAINHLGNNTNAVEKDIVEVMNRTGGMARVFGLANTETAALATTFLSMGLGPERASTAINALTRELMNAPQQTDKFKNALQRVGMTSEELASSIQKGPQKAILDLLQTLSGLDNQTKMETLVGLFGDLYSDEIVQVVNNLDKYKEILGLVAKESNYAGSMQKEFSERIKTTEAQLQLAKNAISEAGINLGNAFLPAVTLAAQGVAGLGHGLSALTREFPGLSAGAVTAITAMAGFGAIRLIWSMMRAEAIALVVPLRAATAAALAFAATPTGLALTAAAAAMYAFGKATSSSVPALMENASAMAKSRTETQEKIKTLEGLRTALATTQPGTKEHTDAEEKLAAILPEANLALDEQGRVLARVGSAASDNARKLNEYIDTLKKEDTQNFALQLDVQARAFSAAKKEMSEYVADLKSEYGIGTGEALTTTQRFWLWIDKTTGSYDGWIAKGAELRRQLNDTEGGMKALITEAIKAGMSMDALGQAMDHARVDPEVKEQVITLFRSMTKEADSAAGKVASVSDAFKKFSVALSGPMAAAKKSMVDAIGAADKQLAKYNEALTQHKEKLKQAVDDETKSWKAMGDAAASTSKNATEQIGIEYDRRRSRIESSTSAELQSERAKAQALSGIFLQENSARLAEANRYQSEALAISQREYQTKIDNAKRLGIEAARVDEERLQSQRHILEQTESAYRQTIDNLIAEEKRHTDAARQLAEQRRDFNLSVSDRLARIAEKGMDPAQVYADRQRRIAQEQTTAEQALRDGNFEQARKHAERMMELADQTSEAVKRGDQAIIDQGTTSARASEQIRKAAEITNQSFQQEAESHEKAAASLRQAYGTATEELGKLHQKMRDLDAELARNHQLILSANMEKVREASKEVDDLLEKKERVVKIRAELQTGATDLESVVSDAAQGATEKVQTRINEASRIFSQFKSEFDGWQPEVKATFNVTAAAGAIDGLVARFNDLRTTVEIPKTVTVTADTQQAISAVEAVRSNIDALQDKTITITTIRREVEAHAAGGAVGFARGGFLPGWGGGDKIRALLEAGEFVLNRHAVRMYGLDRLYAMNQMRLNPAEIPRFAHGGLVQAIRSMRPPRINMPAIPRFEFGGLVRNLVIPTIPQVAFANGGSVAPQVESVVRLDLFAGGRQVASIPGPRQQIRQIVNAVKELQRGTM